MDSFWCAVNLCNSSFETIKELLAHLRTFHSHSEYAEGLHCQVFACSTVSPSYHAYRMHMYRKHKDLQQALHVHVSTSTDDLISENEMQLPISLNLDSADSDEDAKEKFYKNFFRFCVMCKEKYMLPNSVYKSICCNMVSLFSQFKAICLNNVECDATGIPDIDLFWLHMQKDSVYKELCRNLGFVEPERVVISMEKCHFYYYVPILNSLKAYISHTDVFTSIVESEDADHSPHILCDYTDGEYFVNNQFFQGNRKLLRLHLYCDELEVCNPVGKAKSVHKLLCFYYILGNVNVRYWSSLRNIHLVCLIKSSVAKYYSFCLLLQKLKQDLLVLERDGLRVTLPDGYSRVFQGSVATISADNLGSHEVGGFRRCFSSGPICRFCLCSYADLSSKMHESAFTLRNSVTHQYHVKSVAENPALTSVYGVRCQSPFHGLDAFDVTKCLPPDLMHDVLEGVLPILLRAVVDNLVESKILTKAEFSDLLRCFHFGKNDNRNKPTSWLKETGSGLTASQAWCLFRILPFVIGNFISIDHPLEFIFTLFTNL